MMQIIDISKSVNLDEKILENQMLEIINATTSHELRNPLGSILGQNVKKQALFKQIKEFLTKGVYDLIPGIVNELIESTNIQNASGKIMNFLI